MHPTSPGLSVTGTSGTRTATWGRATAPPTWRSPGQAAGWPGAPAQSSAMDADLCLSLIFPIKLSIEY